MLLDQDCLRVFSAPMFFYVLLYFPASILCLDTDIFGFHVVTHDFFMVHDI